MPTARRSVSEMLLPLLTCEYLCSDTAERLSYPHSEIASSECFCLEEVSIESSPGEFLNVLPSLNSVTINLRLRKNDLIDSFLVEKLSSFFMKRAEKLEIIRRQANPGWDLSFLISSDFLTSHEECATALFFEKLLTDLKADVSSLKIGINSRARFAAESLLMQF